MAENDSEILLKMENITKRFPGVLALDNAHLTLKRGSVHALMGENGAGKSTLMKCLFGINKIDSGVITLLGQEVSFANAKDALDHGVAMVHQELNQAMTLSVMENMYLGRIPRISPYLPFISEKELLRRCRKVFDELGFDIDPKCRIKSLSVSKRQLIEIAKAVSYGARVIVFDEPTSSLNGEEAEKLFSIIEGLKARGCGIIYISHKMDEIFRIADEITVMRDGRHITTAPAETISMDKIISLMVGRELTERYPTLEREIGEPILTVEGLSTRGKGVRELSLSVLEHEVLGIAGLDGAGRTALVETLFGLRATESGRITLRSHDISNRTPKDAIKHGFALVSEERRRTGIFPVLSVLENTTISSLKKFSTGPLLSRKRMQKATRERINALKIKVHDSSVKIEALSGGNQQKVIIGRWLLTDPVIMMLDEPTRGIDVGAKYEIYKLILEFAKTGGGVIMVSSEMSELLGLCDRIAVMHEGRLVGTVEGKNASQEHIMRMASGEL